MLLGRTGKWVLVAPFTKYSTTGLVGEVVTAGFIQTLVSKGQDIKNNVYGPVGATSLYEEDLKNNILIVNIESKGKLYAIPDRYITNLYDGQQNFRYHYMTVKVGLLPDNFDMTEAIKELARSVSEVTGVDVKTKDIYVGVSETEGITLDDESAVYENLKRVAKIEDNDSIFTKLKKATSSIGDLTEKYDSVASAYTKVMSKLG